MEAPGALVMVAVLRLGAIRATPRSAILANIPSGQVSMDDRWGVAEQEGQASGHIVQDGAFQADGDVGLGLRRRFGVQYVVEASQ